MSCRRTLLAAALAEAILGSSVQAAFQNPPACRKYAAETTRSGSGAGTEACTYNEATNQYVCMLNLIQPANHVSSMRQYASKADFVDEVRVLPPISRAQSGTTTYSPSGPGAQNSTLTFRYDAQRRQTELTFQFPDRVIRGTYTEWDAAGRPTAMNNQGQSLRYSYDDARRAMTIRNITSGGSQVHTFDVNGNEVKEDIVSPTGAASSTTMAIHRTGQVCR